MLEAGDVMIKGKKGTDTYAFLLVCLSVFIIWQAVGALLEKEGALGFEIGEVQAKFVGAVEYAETELFYVDEAAKLAANKALLKLGKNGGLREGGNCRPQGEIFVWAMEECPLNDNVIESNFEYYFKQEFEEIIREKGYRYDYDLIGYRITGMSPSHVKKDGRGDLVVSSEGFWGYRKFVNNQEGVSYSVRIDYDAKPNFIYDTGFDFDVYIEILNHLKNPDNNCDSIGAGCFDINAPEWEGVFMGQPESDPSGIYTFTLNHNVVNDRKEEPIIIKFKINDYNNL